MNPVVLPFFHSASSTWTYLVHDADSSDAIIIDPVLDFDSASGRTSGTSIQRVLDTVTRLQLRLRWILETHAHADHLSAGHWLKQRCPDARLAIGAGIVKVQARFAQLFNLSADFRVDGTQFDHLLGDDEHFRLGDIDARVIATPGHTPDSVSYLIGDALFAGDSLFMPDGGTARCDFPGGNAAMLYRSIHRLYQLPERTRVFVCHDYAPGGRAHACETSIADQKAGNIHTRLGVSESDYVALREARDATLAMPALLLPSIQVNIRAGALPEAEDNGLRYLKLPLDAF
jgi:glyoxylase-like metal-dependent hydrolase (beta-lactamase superfamily II)